MLASDYLFDVLNEKTDSSILTKWILGDLIEDALPDIQRSDFALYFLNYLQEQTTSVIENCPLNRREDAELIQAQAAKRNSGNSDSNANIHGNEIQVVAKRTPTHVRKLLASPGDKPAAHSLKRVTPQPCESFPQNQLQRNGLHPSASFPVTQVYSNSNVFANSCAPMIFDPRLGYNVPYYGNRNYNAYYHHQQQPAVSNQCLPNNYVNNNLHIRNVNPNLTSFSHQLPNHNVFRSCSNPIINPSFNSVPSSPQKNTKGYQVSRDISSPFSNNHSSPQKNNKGYQTPKTPVSNKIEPKTPNSNSSCSSGVSLMSPESPLYSENFPAMGSNERKNNRRENTRINSESTENGQCRKHSHNKKRIKPTQLNKTTGNDTLQDDFGKHASADAYSKGLGKFPERKQNFFEDKVLLNCDLDSVDLKNASVNSLEIENISEKKLAASTLLVSPDNKSSPELEEINDCLLACEKIEEKEILTTNCSSDIKDKSSPSKKSNKTKKSAIPDPSKVEYKSYLMKLAEIYCALLDANLIPNITAEIYFIFSLLTMDASYKKVKSKTIKPESCKSYEKDESLSDKIHEISLNSLDENKLLVKSDECSVSVVDQNLLLVLSESKKVVANAELQLFDNMHQCVYFACAVLSRQKHFLSILDKATLKLLMTNNRLSSFVPEFIEYLKNLTDKKEKEFRCRQEIHLVTEGIINPVTFQMERDNRDTFTSDPSFHIFRKQRDNLYEILQLWNEKHEKRDWNFNMLSSRIEKLFLMSSDPVNMRHLARHFCDLLLKTVSTRDNETEEYSVSGMPKIDKSKLNRLTERLIRPSASAQKDPRPSPDFPGLQAFYRDFLVIPAANYSFHAHVINSLTERIDLLNGTSFQFEERDINGLMVQEETRLSFLKCLQSLCLLAKFLGLVVFSPYLSSSELPQSVLQDEISIRNKIHPPLDLQQYLVVAEDEGRLVQTVPWIIEYLGMMDAAAPFLMSYQTVLNTLFSLYLRTAPYFYSDISTFYFQIDVASIQSSDENSSEIVDKSENIQTKKKSRFSWQTAVLLRLSIGWLFDTSNFSQSLFFNMASSYKKNLQRKEHVDEKWHNMTVDNSDIVDEKLLREFCPYLVNLKVRLAESTNKNKQGPIRHITPVPSQPTASSKTFAASTLELQLEENFFMGQSESLRRTVDFVAERAASACIKHICSSIIVNLKTSILKLKVSHKLIDLQPFIDKYNKSVEEEIENVITHRLNIALSALLGPDVIEQSLNNICQQIAARKLHERVVNWLQSHINIAEILMKTQVDGYGQSDAYNSSQNQNACVPTDCLPFSEALILMQDLLNDVLDSRGSEGIKTSSDVIDVFKKLSATVSYYCDNTANIKLLLSLALDYLLMMVTYDPKEVTSDVLEEFCNLWKLYNYPGPLSRLLSPRNMMLLAQGGKSNNCLTWEKFGRIIVSVLTYDVLSISNLESQAVAFFRHCWPNDILQSVSKCLNGILEDVRKHPACVDDPKFVLMLELCSEIAADMNNFDELDY